MDYTSGMPIPQGFSKDTLEDYYKGMIQPIKSDTTMQVGQVRSNMLERGLEGTPSETGGVAAANYYGGLRKDQLRGTTGMGMAQMGNQDYWKNYGYDWNKEENKTSREFNAAQQEKLLRLQNDFAGDAANTAYRRGYQSQLWNAGASLAIMGAGSML